MNTFENIWYISKYAQSPKYAYPTRQYFFSKYMFKLGRKVTFIHSRSTVNSGIPKMGLKNSSSYEYQGLKGVVLNGPEINLGFNFKRILSWLIFEIRLLFWAFFSKKNKPDVIIVSSLSILTFLSGTILKKYFKCKLICEVRDIWPLTLVETKGWSNKNIFIRFLRYVEVLGYKNANAIVGSMPNLKEHVKNVNDNYSSKVFYMPMGFDPEYWVVDNKEEINTFKDIYRKYNPSNHFTLGYAGTIGVANCVDQIIEAATLLKSKPIIFAILGGGPLKEELKQTIEKRKLDNILFLEPVPKSQVQHFLKSCDLLLNPINGKSLYKYGVSPNKWIDYMFSGKPILVSLTGFHSIINEAGCGRFIESDNIQALTDTILEFSLMDRAQLEEMGQKGKEYVINHLNYEVLTKKYLEIIDNL